MVATMAVATPERLPAARQRPVLEEGPQVPVLVPLRGHIPPQAAPAAVPVPRMVRGARSEGRDEEGESEPQERARHRPTDKSYAMQWHNPRGPGHPSATPGELTSIALRGIDEEPDSEW